MSVRVPTAAASATATGATMVAEREPWTPVHQRFAEVAATAPGRLAIVAAAARLSYGELERRSDRVAAALLGHGVSPDTVVGIALGRGPAMVVALLGVLKAGAAYLPLDPAYPPERLGYMVDDSAAAVVLTDASTPAALRASTTVPALDLDDRTLWSREHALGERPRVLPGHLAYVIYTSGSTGRPKPVQVTHGGLTGLVDALRLAGVARPESVVAWNASLSFDASVQQWVRLCDGSRLLLLDERLRSDPAALGRFLVEQEATDLDVTPTHLELLVGELRASRPAPGRPPLRLLVGGEALRPKLWASLVELERAGIAEAINLYGTTECTVDSTLAWVRGGERPHVGSPLPAVRAYVLDDRLRPVAAGEAGELYVAGWGLARGYGRRPSLTAERFLPDPFAADGSRMYRTGDRVRRAGKRLEFLGRVDDQVKLRGFRIELGEVETVLSQADGVDAAVATLREDPVAGTQLVAYCRGTGLRVDAVRDWAVEHLPGFMVPAVFVPCDSFPVNGSGKVDRSALPEPTAVADDEAVPEPFEAPSGRFERLVAEAWEEVLGVDRVSAADDFYHIGGNSLLAVTVAAKLRRLTGRFLPMTAVMEHTTLRGLAAHLAGADAGGAHGQTGS